MTHPLNPAYRTHMCGDLRAEHTGQSVKLAGWIYRRRDHGGKAFIDMRDHAGVVQLVFDGETVGEDLVEQITHLTLESVIQVDGEVARRAEGQMNPHMPTGDIEIWVSHVQVLSEVEQLPYNISEDVPEDLRLKYRFMDLRTERMHANLKLRCQTIQFLRQRMWEEGFQEIQTPVLTASSPEGARDYLVPSRTHPGKFYALPQAPQQFKQLLMCAGFDRYFQVAPCFRDEDARADRTPGDFYQLDMEMSFVTQEDVFAVNEKVLGDLFAQVRGSATANWRMDKPSWKRIPYTEAMLKYSSDKPDLRCPLEIMDVSDTFRASDFKVFANIVANGGVVRAVPAPGAGSQPRSWFDDIGNWAQKELGAPAAPGYITKAGDEFKGPLVKFLKQEQIEEMFKAAGLKIGDALFFVAGKPTAVHKVAGPLRVRLGADLGLNETEAYRFCWIVDFPMYELDEDTGKIEFSHNPFSMPQGEMEALEKQDPLEIKAWQYDLVCNGFELSSGAIRNHKPEIMYKAFDIAGHTAEAVEARFGGMIRALKHGAPPHGGFAPGIDRMVMLLANTENIREIIAFPLTQRGEDLLMGAPSPASPTQLKELYLQHRGLPEE